jgi:hypothetical protein
MPALDIIPTDFIDRLVAEDWRDRPGSDDYYPTGVTDATRVSVVIRHNGVSTLHENLPAQCFGWYLRPAMPSCAGLNPSDAPVTHYKILDQ